MFVSTVSKVALQIFGINRPIDYVIRPLLTIVIVVLTNMGVRSLLQDPTPVQIVVDAMVAALVATPFVAICYILVIHQAQTHRNLSEAAQTDELTGLPNRRAFLQRSGKALQSGRHGFFLIVDADHFKRINDTLGHPVGDICLQAIADRLVSLLRKGDLIGRLGGEEFGIILFDRTMEDLQRAAGRMCFPIKVSVADQPTPLRLTVSAGATEIQPNDTPQTVSARADDALLAAKNNGRERMVLWKKSTAKRPAA